MALLDMLVERSQVKKGPACKLRTWLDTLDAKQREQIAEAFRDQRVLHRVLADWISEQPDAPKATASNISHHRNGNCAGCASLNLVRP